jgi:hypothetical protein
VAGSGPPEVQDGHHQQQSLHIYDNTTHITKKDPLAFENEAQMYIHVSIQKKPTTLGGDVKKALFGRITTQNA